MLGGTCGLHAALVIGARFSTASQPASLLVMTLIWACLVHPATLYSLAEHDWMSSVCERHVLDSARPTAGSASRDWCCSGTCQQCL